MVLHPNNAMTVTNAAVEEVNGMYGVISGIGGYNEYAKPTFPIGSSPRDMQRHPRIWYSTQQKSWFVSVGAQAHYFSLEGPEQLVGGDWTCWRINDTCAGVKQVVSSLPKVTVTKSGYVVVNGAGAEDLDGFYEEATDDMFVQDGLDAHRPKIWRVDETYYMGIPNPHDHFNTVALYQTSEPFPPPDRWGEV